MSKITRLIGNTCKFGTPLLTKRSNKLAIYVGIKPPIETEFVHYVMLFLDLINIRIPTLRIVSNKGVIPIGTAVSGKMRNDIMELSESIRIASLKIEKLPKLSVILGWNYYVIYLGGDIFIQFNINCINYTYSLANLGTLRNFIVNDGKLVFLTNKKEKEKLFNVILDKTDNYKENDIHFEYQTKNTRKKAKYQNSSLMALARYMMKKKLGRTL